jgi:hypothetical protein
LRKDSAGRVENKLGPMLEKETTILLSYYLLSLKRKEMEEL